MQCMRALRKENNQISYFSANIVVETVLRRLLDGANTYFFLQIH